MCHSQAVNGLHLRPNQKGLFIISINTAFLLFFETELKQELNSVILIGQP